VWAGEAQAGEVENYLDARVLAQKHGRLMPLARVWRAVAVDGACLLLACDGCQAQLDEADEGVWHASSPVEVLTWLPGTGWRQPGPDQHYCSTDCTPDGVVDQSRRAGLHDVPCSDHPCRDLPRPEPLTVTKENPS
jgi:hypothetical protein